MKELIFSQGDFSLVKESGIGRNDVEWSGLKVISEGNADKHVVEVRLLSDNVPQFDKSPVVYRYSGVYVAHGMRSASDTLAETKEYIDVLTDALEFAKRVEKYINDNEEWRE